VPTLLQIHDLHFAHGDQPVLHGVELSLAPAEVLVVLGPSGCGKSTLLRLIAGLERPQSGVLRLGDTVLSEGRTFVPPEQRPIGMVFQGLALFPHLSVAGNVGFGLHRLPKAERAARVAAELAAVGLTGLEERYPHQLSGGQQQRVAIARSLVLRPHLLLMDEPFSDLDGNTRREVRSEVLRILKEHGTAAIIVSHDQEDAMHLADRIVRMEAGRVVEGSATGVLRSGETTSPTRP
jgi:iron(III) transport system ATP-binding protein